MSEHEPRLTFEVNNAEYEVRRNNSQLWTFIGRTALDHVWLEHHVDSDGTAVGNRFWREVFKDNKMFDTVAQYMIFQSYEAHTNLVEVPDCDMDAYILYSSANEEEPEWL